MTTLSFRDVELVSAYLDGQLAPSDAARLELRLESDADLRAVLDDLRAARGVLRKLPLRKAPRKFTLTPKMAGIKPPLPRAYPVLRFATALTTLLFFFSFAIRAIGPVSFGAAAPAPSLYGMGGGGGGAPEEAPAATEAPAEPSTELQLAPTSEAADSARSVEDATEVPTPEPMPKGLAPESESARPASPAMPAWQIGLLILTVALWGGTWLIRILNDRKWRTKVR